MLFSRRSLTIYLCAVAGAVTLSSSQAQSWQRYFNNRYGFTIEYPDFFRPEPPPDNGDGNKFTARDGAVFVVWASHVLSPGTILDYEKYIRSGSIDYSQVTYRSVGAKTLVLSGYRDNSIFYEKYTLTHYNKTAISFSIIYPAQLKDIYDPVTSRMAISFRPDWAKGDCMRSIFGTCQE
jgi:hypothetical protein